VQLTILVVIEGTIVRVKVSEFTSSSVLGGSDLPHMLSVRLTAGSGPPTVKASTIPLTDVVRRDLRTQTRRGIIQDMIVHRV